MQQRAAALVHALGQARHSRRPVDGTSPEWAGLTRAEADAVAAQLLEQWGAAGSPYWKLGAVDEPAQRRLGVSGPVFAPLDPSEVRVDCASAEVALSRFIRPKFEAEIGVCVTADGLRPMPCVEIADSRFEGWALPPNGVIADAGLQGAMVFGEQRDTADTVRVVVRLDGEELGRGEGTWHDAAARLSVLPPGARVSHVATGSLTALFEARPGRWEFDFGDLGSVRVTVT